MKLTPPPRSSLAMRFDHNGSVYWCGPGLVGDQHRPSIIWYAYTQVGRKLVWADAYEGFSECSEEEWNR